MDEFLESQAVYDEVAEADVFDLDDLFGHPICDRIGYITYNLRGAEQGGLKGGGSGVYDSGFCVSDDGLSLSEENLYVFPVFFIQPWGFSVLTFNAGTIHPKAHCFRKGSGSLVLLP